MSGWSSGSAAIAASSFVFEQITSFVEIIKFDIELYLRWPRRPLLAAALNADIPGREQRLLWIVGSGDLHGVGRDLASVTALGDPVPHPAERAARAVLAKPV
jgi:hypothetical protein